MDAPTTVNGGTEIRPMVNSPSTGTTIYMMMPQLSPMAKFVLYVILIVMMYIWVYFFIEIMTRIDMTVATKSTWQIINCWPFFGQIAYAFFGDRNLASFAR